ncbi:MAG TPA: ABC transporter permease [Trebonia sp.]|nr:ABC transporter permease [Trebonia sp.]
MTLTLPEPGFRLAEPGLRLGALIRHDATLMLRQPGPVISRLLQPLVLIVLMHPLYAAALATDGPQAGTVQAVTGMLVMFSLLALSVVGTGIMTERAWKTWDRLRATPARPAELLVAKAVPAFALLIVLQAEVIGFGVAVFGLDVSNPALLALAVAAWGLALLGIGMTLGAVLRSQGELNVAYDIGGILFSALGGALIPSAELPGWAQAIAPASPGYWAMGALRSALHGQAGGTLRDSGMLAVIAVVTCLLAARRMSRTSPRGRLL